MPSRELWNRNSTAVQLAAPSPEQLPTIAPEPTPKQRHTNSRRPQRLAAEATTTNACLTEQHSFRAVAAIR